MYGLLGHPLGHSFSKELHAQFADYEYQYFDRKEEELEDFLKDPALQGLNVTIPYKETVMQYCAEISDKAKRIGCVNTLVRREDGSWYGDNTDYDGFRWMLESYHIHIKDKHVVILGQGATSKTAKTVVEDLGAKSVRRVDSHKSPHKEVYPLKKTQVLINCTPVGMFPNNGKSLVKLNYFHHLESVVDVVYNPLSTKLILDAKRMGYRTATGLRMLVAQAKYAAERFTGEKIPDDRMQAVYRKMYETNLNIVLVGMPGCGKSTVARKLGERTGRPVYDSDAEFKEMFGLYPSEYLKDHSEKEFRKRESEVLAELGKRHGVIISTGGGSILLYENHDALKQNARVYYLRRKLYKLSTKNRPLSQGGMGQLKRLYRQRYKKYEKISDVTVPNEKTSNFAANWILEEWNAYFNAEWSQFESPRKKRARSIRQRKLDNAGK